ncbi:hypothetical protein HY04_07365 [Kaistella antarctica]|uniref:Uncharacterized protein n=1 Tax=Kaistella antarctica TaxID=266748 RepID=A0ABR4TWK0_9FLAO|nr:hypothetical protein HY04_07365 [Kaistella antarctica]
MQSHNETRVSTIQFKNKLNDRVDFFSANAKKRISVQPARRADKRNQFIFLQITISIQLKIIKFETHTCKDSTL